MFDKLIESTKQKSGGRTGRLALLTAVVYGAMLTITGVVTIFWFNPVLADAFKVETMLVPPVPSAPRPAVQQTVTRNNAAPTSWIAPTHPPVTVDPHAVPPAPPPTNGIVVAGSPGGPVGIINGIPGGRDEGPGEPPPPPVTKKPDPTPEPKPSPPPQRPVTRTSTILQGTAIRKVQPVYPAIAKAARVQGPVQVQVEISEEGQVTSVAVLSGHPLLRDAAVQAARQWLWRPTLLGNVPVRVQGVLTFNFVLN
ncbi:MAG TPA: energy transducer TonB [Blastocatellia bacterium]|nr:energy transducer TonB [Blastocatellia bacterium]